MIRQTNDNSIAIVFGVNDEEMQLGMDVNDDNFGSFSIRENGNVIGLIFTDPMQAMEVGYYINQVAKCMLAKSKGEEVNKEEYFVQFKDVMGLEESK